MPRYLLTGLTAYTQPHVLTSHPRYEVHVFRGRRSKAVRQTPSAGTSRGLRGCGRDAEMWGAWCRDSCLGNSVLQDWQVLNWIGLRPPRSASLLKNLKHDINTFSQMAHPFPENIVSSILFEKMKQMNKIVALNPLFSVF